MSRVIFEFVSILMREYRYSSSAVGKFSHIRKSVCLSFFENRNVRWALSKIEEQMVGDKAFW